MEKREYFGGALYSFILALGHSPTVVEKILRDAGIERLDPQGWYDFDRAIAVPGGNSAASMISARPR